MKTKKIMTPEEFENAMKKIDKLTISDDPNLYPSIEEAHVKADKLMCKVLKQLGYSKGCRIFEDMEKWYS